MGMVVWEIAAEGIETIKKSERKKPEIAFCTPFL